MSKILLILAFFVSGVVNAQGGPDDHDLLVICRGISTKAETDIYQEESGTPRYLTIKALYGLAGTNDDDTNHSELVRSWFANNRGDCHCLGNGENIPTSDILVFTLANAYESEFNTFLDWMVEDVKIDLNHVDDIDDGETKYNGTALDYIDEELRKLNEEADLWEEEIVLWGDYRDYLVEHGAKTKAELGE